jgi:hypothetical protein
MEVQASMPLSRAALCLDCDRVYEVPPGGCPKCQGGHSLLLSRIVKPMLSAEIAVDGTASVPVAKVKNPYA